MQLKYLRDGAISGEMVRAVRDVFRKHRLDQYDVYPPMHGIGLAEAESPYPTRRATYPLRTGMCVNSDISLFGHPAGSNRIEEGFVITGGAPRVADAPHPQALRAGHPLMDSGDFTIRRARPDEADLVVGLINSVWPGDIRERRPWLFTPQRMGDYLLCFGGEELWGTVGAYPYDVRLGGVTFKMAGIGQVITHPEHRGLGIMTMLMDKALGDMQAQGLDAAWLLGDRLRYSSLRLRARRQEHPVRHQQALPAAAAGRGVRAALDTVAELDRIHRALIGQPDTALVPADEMPLLIQGFGMQGWADRASPSPSSAAPATGWCWRPGAADEVALLLAHQAAANAGQAGGPERHHLRRALRPLHVERPRPECLPHTSPSRTAPTSASLSPRSFLEKAAQSRGRPRARRRRCADRAGRGHGRGRNAQGEQWRASACALRVARVARP